MKHLLCALFTLLLFGQAAHATNYYVSATEGNDANRGTAATEAWQTLKKVDAMNGSFVAGDSILFKKGDIFYGSLTISGRKGTDTRPLVYSAYGVGAMPVFRASQKLGGWQRLIGAIWKTTLSPLSRPGNTTLVYYRTPSLFIKNVAQQIGREPNYTPTDGGFRTISSHAVTN
jgi:hypothetical protein